MECKMIAAFLRKGYTLLISRNTALNCPTSRWQRPTSETYKRSKRQHEQQEKTKAWKPCKQMDEWTSKQTDEWTSKQTDE